MASFSGLDHWDNRHLTGVAQSANLSHMLRKMRTWALKQRVVKTWKIAVPDPDDIAFAPAEEVAAAKVPWIWRAVTINGKVRRVTSASLVSAWRKYGTWVADAEERDALIGTEMAVNPNVHLDRDYYFSQSVSPLIVPGDLLHGPPECGPEQADVRARVLGSDRTAAYKFEVDVDDWAWDDSVVTASLDAGLVFALLPTPGEAQRLSLMESPEWARIMRHPGFFGVFSALLTGPALAGHPPTK
jgi:hypothetical protein